MLLEATLVILAVLVALWLAPWRMLVWPAAVGRGRTLSPLVSPLLATLVLLPWIWALPTLHAMPLQLQWSGACLVVLMLGWPLAVLTLVAVGVLACWFSPAMDWAQALGTIAWLGVVPATFALLLGALIRRFIGAWIFVYVLGRAFLGTVLCVFVSAMLAQWSGHTLPGVDEGLSLVGHWLMAWGDGFITGMFAAIFVAFKPEWLATWSDKLYLHPPPR